MDEGRRRRLIRLGFTKAVPSRFSALSPPRKSVSAVQNPPLDGAQMVGQAAGGGGWLTVPKDRLIHLLGLIMPRSWSRPF